MDGHSHLSIAEREDIMVRRKGHEGVSQIARELHGDKSTISREIIPRDQAERLAGPCRTPLPRVYGTEEGGQEEAALRAPQAHGRTREALAGRERCCSLRSDAKGAVPLFRTSSPRPPAPGSVGIVAGSSSRATV